MFTEYGVYTEYVRIIIWSTYGVHRSRSLGHSISSRLAGASLRTEYFVWSNPYGPQGATFGHERKKDQRESYQGWKQQLTNNWVDTPTHWSAEIGCSSRPVHFRPIFPMEKRHCGVFSLSGVSRQGAGISNLPNAPVCVHFLGSKSRRYNCN